MQKNLFDGRTYDPALDEDRLKTQLGRVYTALTKLGGRWTLRDLADACGGSEAAVSARLRDLRKPKFGAHPIQAKRLAGGIWQYWYGRENPGAK